MKPGSRTVAAARWTTASAVLRTLLAVSQTAILVRLLNPGDFGLMAIVTVLLSFTTLMMDLGVNSAYVQRRNVSDNERSSLFWLNVIVAVLLSLLLVALSPLIARLFSDARLGPLVAVSSLIIVVSSFGQQVRMSAEKELRFRPVVLIEITAAILGTLTACTCAWMGLGVYSMILGAAVTAAVATVLAWAFVARGWRPQPRFRMDDVRSYMGFGLSMVGNGFMRQLNASLDLFFGGRALLSADLGFYSVPRNLVLQVQHLINPIVSRITFPLIAERQANVSLVKNIYLSTLGMTLSISAPIYLAIFFFAPEVISIYFGGDEWTSSTGLLQILALWGLVRSTGNPSGSLVAGMGRAQTALKWNILMTIVSVPFLWVGAKFGAGGLAGAMLIQQCVMFYPRWKILIWPVCAAPWSEYTLSIGRPIIIALVSVGPAWYVTSGIEGSLLRLLTGLSLSAALYLSSSFVFNRQWLEAMYSLLKLDSK